MTTLLDSNTRLGQELADARKDLSAARDDLSKANKKIGVLESEIKYLKGKQNGSNRQIPYFRRDMQADEEDRT